MNAGHGSGRRLGILALWLVAAAGVAWALCRLGPDTRIFPKCLFHHFTGLHCPGCGMTRAAFACLHGDWLRAFRLNPLLMSLLPVLALGLAWELFWWLRCRPAPLRWRPGKRAGILLLAMLLLFWVLRNLPGWPFTLLAPP